MPLRLSDAEVTDLERAYTTLLAPFSYEDGEGWRRASAQAVQQCLGGDGSSFDMLVPGEAFVVSPSAAVADALNKLDPPPDWLVHALTVRRRQLGLTISDWEDLFDLRKLRKTDFYNESVRPNGISAPLSLFAETGKGPMPAALSVYSADEPAAGRHLRRRKQLMRLLIPAYHAGVRAYLSYRENLAAIDALAEEAPIGVLIFDGRAHPASENAHFKRLMSSEPERDRLRADVAHIVRAILAGPYNTAQHGLRRNTTEIQTTSAAYRIVATLFANEFTRAAAKAIVLIEKIQTAAMDARRLSDQFSFTQRELELAQLLRKGLSTRQIADVLGITLHTTRRHLEHVYVKLQVHSRASAAAKLAGN